MDPRTFTRIAREATFHDAGHGFDVFGLSPPALASVVEMAAPLYERYFRVESDGIENVPTHGAAILVANHGRAWPLDVAMLCLDILRKLDPPRIPRVIADGFAPRLPLVSTLFARYGVVTGTPTNVRHLLEHAELVAMWGPSVAEHAIRHRVPVIPVAIARASAHYRLVYGPPRRIVS